MVAGPTISKERAARFMQISRERMEKIASNRPEPIPIGNKYKYLGTPISS